jgi:hypothetical protein
MPTQQEHLAKAERNAAFAKTLDLSDVAGIEWAMVSLFYSSLHYVEAYLVKIGQPTKSHVSRDTRFRMDKHLKSIAYEYWDLKNFGYRARYEVPNFKASDVIDEAFPALDKVKATIQTIL